jgi:50S ribosomal protein L16 3-hydroxylase
VDRPVTLEAFLGGMPAREFFERHWSRLPLARPGGARAFQAPVDLDRILAAEGVDAFLARDAAMWEGGRSPGPERARAMAADGWTTAVRNAQKHDAGLAGIAAGFAADLGAPVNVHLYATPPGRSGFGWHYDVEDVFILQLEGDKAYSLRKNTVNPWPLLATMPRDLQYEKEGSPAFECRLRAGDWLYIPPGWWHIAKSETESKSLAVGMMSPTALDLLRFLEAELPSSVVWRQRIPRDPDALAKVLRDLGRDLAMAMSDPTLAPKALKFLGS